MTEKKATILAQVSSGTSSAIISPCRLHARSQATRALHHLRRDVDTTNLDTTFMKVTGNMTGTATDIAGYAMITNVFRKTVEKLSVKGLVL
jgi:hypothetical protein